MNRNSLLVIAVLVMVGAGLGVASAQLIAPQSPAETHNNGTDISIESIYAASGYGFDDGMEIEIEPMGEPTPEERQKAIDIALSDSKVKDLLDGKEYEIDYVDCMDTHASVDIYIPNASEGDPNIIRVLVNLDDGNVIDVMPIVDSSRPTPEEQQKAIDIALSDSKVKDLLNGKEYEIDYVELIGDTHALVEIYFPNASEDDPWYLIVLVDLDKKTVVDVILDEFVFVLPPDKPLTPEEEKQAINIALSDSKVKDLLDGKEYEIDYVDCMDTHASVDISIPNASKGDPDYILVLVNLDDGTVIDVMPIVDSSIPTPEERQKTIDIALSDSKVKDLLDGKEYEIDYVELIGDTHALVEIYVPNASEDDPWYLIVLVDLDKKTVVDVILDEFVFVLPPDKPLTPEEEKQAINIALSDPNVKELLKGREYNVSGAYSIPSMPEEDRYASVDIYIPNASANMSACMMLEVNLNESIVEHLSFDMFQADDSWRSMCGSAAGWSAA